MKFLKDRKELIPIIAIAITLGIASYNLFTEQQTNSDILNSGTRLDPVSISGRAACEVPIPDISQQINPKAIPSESNQLIQ